MIAITPTLSDSSSQRSAFLDEQDILQHNDYQASPLSRTQFPTIESCPRQEFSQHNSYHASSL